VNEPHGAVSFLSSIQNPKFNIQNPLAAAAQQRQHAEATEQRGGWFGDLHKGQSIQCTVTT
jgi:hypothetical protein